MSFNSKLTNILFGFADRLKTKNFKVPEELDIHRNIIYGNDPKWNILDIYRLKSETGKLPVIIDVHGGGWVYGDKEVYQFYCMELALKGFAVVNFTYRLAPEHIFPAQLEDLNDAVRFVFENSEKYGLETENIFLGQFNKYVIL